MSKWREYAIGDLGTIVTGRTPPSGQAGLFGEIYPFITPGDMHQGKYARSTDRSLSREGASRFDRIKLPPDSVCVSCIGWQMGEVILTDRESFTNQQINTIILAPGYNPSFIYYSMKTRKRELLSLGSAAGARTPILNKSAFSNLKTRIPDLSTQRRIASILGAYDDLIEVNRRRIALMEEMARRLFEEWFVHFRFPGHDGVPIVQVDETRLPRGWKTLGLHDVAEVAFGFPFKSSRFNSSAIGCRIVRIRDVPAGETATFTDEPFDPRYAVRNGDLLVGMDGIFHTALWTGGEAALNQRVTRLRPRDGRSTMWLLQSVLPKIKHLEATITGTTVAHLSARDLKALSVVAPPPMVQQQADSVLEPIGKAIVTHRLEQHALIQARDLLLPRLISGELTVAAAEKELEAAD